MRPFAQDQKSSWPPGASEWLTGHGYALVTLGVTDEQALGWTPYDVAAFTITGLVSIGAATVLVNRRRPT